MGSLYRMRIELSPEKGALGRLGHALEQVGGSIITIDLQDIDAGRAVDDLVVSFVDVHPTPDLVVEALQEHSAGKLRHWRPVEEAVDPVLQSIRWATSIFSAGAAFADEEVTRVIGEICGTGNTWLFDRIDDRGVAVVTRARNRHGAVTEQVAEVPLGLSVDFEGPSWLLAVPDSSLAPDRVVLVARPLQQTFSATEIERVTAILAVFRQAKLSAPVAMPSGLPGAGPWFDVSNPAS